MTGDGHGNDCTPAVLKRREAPARPAPTACCSGDTWGHRLGPRNERGVLFFAGHRTAPVSSTHTMKTLVGSDAPRVPRVGHRVAHVSPARGHHGTYHTSGTYQSGRGAKYQASIGWSRGSGSSSHPGAHHCLGPCKAPVGSGLRSCGCSRSARPNPHPPCPGFRRAALCPRVPRALGSSRPATSPGGHAPRDS